jgi:hypothetical protein
MASPLQEQDNRLIQAGRVLSQNKVGDSQVEGCERQSFLFLPVWPLPLNHLSPYTRPSDASPTKKILQVSKFASKSLFFEMPGHLCEDDMALEHLPRSNHWLG